MVTGICSLLSIVVSLLCKGFRCTMPHKNFSLFYMYVNYQVFITKFLNTTLVILLSAVIKNSCCQLWCCNFISNFSVKSEPLQTHLSNWFAVTQKQSAHSCLLPAVVCFLILFKRAYFYLINLKRKRALLESNLPAIRLMLIR